VRPDPKDVAAVSNELIGMQILLQTACDHIICIVLQLSWDMLSLTALLSVCPVRVIRQIVYAAILRHAIPDGITQNMYCNSK